MHLVVHPGGAEFDDLDAQALGKAWNKLDEMALALGVEPLSAFLALPDEDESAGVPATRLLATVDALMTSLAAPGSKLPAKRAALIALNHVHDIASRMDANGRVCFEVDI